MHALLACFLALADLSFCSVLFHSIQLTSSYSKDISYINTFLFDFSFLNIFLCLFFIQENLRLESCDCFKSVKDEFNICVNSKGYDSRCFWLLHNGRFLSYKTNSYYDHYNFMSKSKRTRKVGNIPTNKNVNMKKSFPNDNKQQ